MVQVKGDSHVWNGMKVNELQRLHNELLPIPELEKVNAM